MSSPSRILVVSCLVGTFLAGAVSGGFVKASFETKGQKPPQFTADAMTRKMCDRFSNELGLSSEQVAGFERIIHDQSLKIEAAHKRLGSEVRGLFQEMDDQLMALLSADQKVKFVEIKRQRARRFNHPEGEKKEGEKNPKFSGPPSEPPPGPPPNQ